MNYLAHLFLSERTSEGLVGGLMGDFVKGRLDNSTYTPGLLRSIRRHRMIDRYTDDHPSVRRSRRRIHAGYRLLQPIMIDVFYDHFLAVHWRRYSRIELEVFAQQVYEALRSHAAILPGRLRTIARPMMEENWLVSYRERESIALALRGIARRLSRPNRLAQGIDELHAHYDALTADFHEFFPDAVEKIDTMSHAIRNQPGCNE